MSRTMVGRKVRSRTLRYLAGLREDKAVSLRFQVLGGKPGVGMATLGYEPLSLCPTSCLLTPFHLSCLLG